MNLPSVSISNFCVHSVTYLGHDSFLTQAAVEQKQGGKQASCFKTQVHQKKMIKKIEGCGKSSFNPDDCGLQRGERKNQSYLKVLV